MEKRDRGKKAQAQIITIILIILIAIGGILIVWNVVKRTVEESSEQVGTEALMIQLEIKKAQAGAGGGLEVEINRGVGKGNISELKFILEDKDGKTYTETISENLPDELETKTYSLFGLFGVINVKKISVVPVVGNKFGIEASKNVDVSVSMIGLVSWWKFDGDFIDSVGENHGTNYGDAHIEDNVLVLDGDGDYVDCGDKSSLDITDAITISAWIKPTDSQTNSYPRVVDKTSAYLLHITDTAPYDLACNIMRGGAVNQTSMGSQIIANTWNYVTCTFDTSTGIGMVYVDGMLKNEKDFGSIGVTIDTSNYDFFIGDKDAHTRDFNGTIDEVLIFNRSLSATEIQALYNS